MSAKKTRELTFLSGVLMLELFGATRSMKKNKVSHSEMHFRV